MDVTEKKDLNDNGTKQHDVRFELEPSEKLWYEHYLENN